MRKKLFQANDLDIWQEDNHFFAIYDAGSHQVAMRKDEITESDAMTVCNGTESATKMLFELQARLIKAGIDPYKSNHFLKSDDSEGAM